MRIEGPIAAQAARRLRRVEPVPTAIRAPSSERRSEAAFARTRASTAQSGFAAQILGAILPHPRLVAIGAYEPAPRLLRGLMCDLYA